MSSGIAYCKTRVSIGGSNWRLTGCKKSSTCCVEPRTLKKHGGGKVGATYSSGLPLLLLGAGIWVESESGNTSLPALFDKLLLGFIGGDGRVWVLGSLDGTLLLELVDALSGRHVGGGGKRGCCSSSSGTSKGDRPIANIGKRTEKENKILQGGRTAEAG